MDRRFLAFNGRVADRTLEGQVDAETFVAPERKRLIANAWLVREPGGAIDRECLYGDPFDVLEWRDGYAFGRAYKDGYVGWLPAAVLAEARAPTHWIKVRSTWAYAKPDIKTEPVKALHMTSRVSVSAVSDEWATLEAEGLFVPVGHLAVIGDRLDQVAAARAFLGTPYVWAGNSGFGIDCSGLVQVSAHAAGFACAPDSDLQEAMSGLMVETGAPLVAGDLVFWRGHVALATGDDTLIHANAHHMCVVEEPVRNAVERIASSDTGKVTSRLRPELADLW